MIPYHLTNLALPTHALSHICKLSCTQASPSPHAGTRLRFYRNRTYDIRHPLMPGVGQSTTSGEPTRRRCFSTTSPHQQLPPRHWNSLALWRRPIHVILGDHTQTPTLIASLAKSPAARPLDPCTTSTHHEPLH